MEKRFGESLDHWHSADEKSPKKNNTAQNASDILYHEAIRLKNEKRYAEALTLINVAIENDEDCLECHITRGVILENLNRYQESCQAYDRALEITDDEKIYENKARALYRWANSLNDKSKAVKLIDEAIEILPLKCNDEYFEKFWYLKGSIHDCLGQPIESRRCYLMAEGMRDEISQLDAQVDFLRNSKDTLINITGTRFYFGLEPFRKGLVVSLVREPDNEHDEDAIRVEVDGETVGYVANNDYTLVENVKSASEIKGLKADRAEVVLIYMDEYVIARLVM